jgi:intein/homing endonuclease
MKNSKVIDIKYLAGLMDSDGNFNINRIDDGYVRFTVSVSSSENTDKDFNMLTYISETFKLGSTRTFTNNYGQVRTWTVASLSEQEQLLPLLIKHLVVKGTYAQYCLNIRRLYKGRKCPDEEWEVIKEELKRQRQTTKATVFKKHMTWAWFAGFVDGDGCLAAATKFSDVLKITNHINDIAAIKLIQHSIGGSIRPINKKPWLYNYQLTLGIRTKQQTIKILSKYLQHTKMKHKKYKAEQIIAKLSARRD